ncbi:MAG TPA: ATP-binding protein [Roseiflexaceae bacterium]|nr:ATP-binding protein [Roseiflexaceae bacterium]
MPFSHPDFGRLFPCACKRAEQEQKRARRLIEISNIGPFVEKTFASFNPTIHGVQRAYLRARAYAEHPRGWLVLLGKYGVGKTHLAAAIANELLRNHYQVLFAVVPDLLDHLRSTFGPNSEVEYDKRFEDIRDSHVLILDDLGTENASGWAREKLFQIINHRYNYAMPTVITSNRDPKDIDQRIFSRMSDRALCEELTVIDADDFRVKTVEQRYPINRGRRRPGER